MEISKESTVKENLLRDATGVSYGARNEVLSAPGTTTPRARQIGDRIKEIRGKRKQEDFASWLDIGISAQTLGRYERGEREPGDAFIHALRIKEQVDPAWLLFGEGRPLVANDQAGARFLPADQVLVPRYNLRAAAERGHIDTTADLIGFYGYGDAWVRGNLKADPAHLCVGIVVGDSMEPDLYDGEEILVDLSVTQYVGDAIYLVRFESSLMIKQLQRVLGGTLRLVSRNERYESQTVHDRGDLLGVDFQVIGRVLGKPKFIKL